jgi:DNA-binding response OmpR family regulator
MARVLVVADDERNGRLVAWALAHDGHDTQRVGAGTEGLTAALANDFELVILDLLLPGMPGGEVLERLVRERPEEPVLVLSAVSNIGARVAALEAGAADFLGKPFAVAELLARVRARLRSRAAAGAANGTLRAGPVVLDPRRRRAHINGTDLALPPREFMLLQHLMSRPGQVCTRRELLADVWGLKFNPGSNVVDVYVRRLRGKLDRPDRIETVRHVGYAFAVD